MSATTTMRCRVTLDEAKAILATEPTGTERWALANTIVSLSAAIEMLATDDDDVTAAMENGEVVS